MPGSAIIKGYVMKNIIILFLLLICAVSLSAQEKEVVLDLSFSNPVLLDNGKQTNFLRIGLTGFEIKAFSESRPGINASIVLDVSGSMSGEKLEQAIQAAHTAVDMLKNGDAVSIITYSDYAHVLVPATKLTQQNRRAYHLALDRISADGYTALFSGVSMGGRELETFFDANMVNRVILLSDGLANVGPSTPGELGNLGEILRNQGVAVSTIGLGTDYNDALMFELAARSDGNHAFVEHPEELVDIFQKEFNSILSVVAQDLKIKINCGDGIRPVGLINRKGEIFNSEVFVSVNQIYSNQDLYIILEVEVEGREAGSALKGAEVELSYLNLITGEKSDISKITDLSFSSDKEYVKQQRDEEATADAVLQKAVLVNQEAVALRDEGKIEEAEELLLMNASILNDYAEDLSNEELEDYAEQNFLNADQLYEEDWDVQSKEMRDEQFLLQNNQTY